MYKEWDSLGSLMLAGLRHTIEFMPGLVTERAKAGTLGRDLLQMAQNAQLSLYGSAETDEDRYFLWSDMRWETGLFPPEHANGPKNQRLAKQWVKTLGGQYEVVEKALKEADLGHNWNPENRIGWKEEQEYWAKNPQGGTPKA